MSTIQRHPVLLIMLSFSLFFGAVSCNECADVQCQDTYRFQVKLVDSSQTLNYMNERDSTFFDSTRGEFIPPKLEVINAARQKVQTWESGNGDQTLLNIPLNGIQDQMFLQLGQETDTLQFEFVNKQEKCCTHSIKPHIIIHNEDTLCKGNCEDLKILRMPKKQVL